MGNSPSRFSWEVSHGNPVSSWTSTKGLTARPVPGDDLRAPRGGSRTAACLCAQLQVQQGAFVLPSRGCRTTGNVWCPLALSQPQATFFSVTGLTQNCWFLECREPS